MYQQRNDRKQNVQSDGIEQMHIMLHMEIHQLVHRHQHDHMHEVNDYVHRQHVENESGVVREQVAVVI